MSFSIIIPSKTDANLGTCVSAIRDAGEKSEIIVLDDFEGQTRMLPPEYEPIDWIIGEKPFIFARNINMGIRSCHDDVILLNDDALLNTPMGFTAMHSVLRRNPDIGVLSATTNIVGNPAQHYQESGGLRYEARTLAFVCVMISRRAIELVGLLDEAFTAYGWEDNDYCRRVREAGLKLGIFDGCFVDHGSLQSTFRGHPRAFGNIQAGAEIYRSKWGDLN